ncbi:MAG: hypothetical protein AMJ53_11405 [Gammaproteobacteria bacterium SG8_11]|nr:MAG: hypothetical protein AMJ53_11405 [Gammaproteobacteria bacterium SG8_11]
MKLKLISLPLFFVFFATLYGCNEAGEQRLGRSTPLDEICKLQMSFSGEITDDLDWGTNEGCGGGTSQNDMVEIAFGNTSTTLNIIITIFDLVEEETNVSKSAQAKIYYKADGRTWETASGSCTVAISENALISSYPNTNTYAVAGSVSCNTAAQPDTNTGATSAIIIDDSTFRTMVAW